jgi:ParB family chromosome partitioning protein
MAEAIGQLEKVRALAVSGRLLVLGGVRAAQASQLTFYDFLSEKLERRVDVAAHVLALAADEERVVAATSDGRLLVFASKSGELVRELRAHTGASTAVALRAGLLASAGADGTVALFDAESFAEKARHELSARPLAAVAIDPNGSALAAAGEDGVVRVVFSDGLRREMPGHDGRVLALEFTPQDGRLVSGGEDGTIRIWYLVGEIEAELRASGETGHAGGTTSLLFLPATAKHPEGSRLLSAGVDGKVRLFRTDQRRKPRTFELKGPLFALARAPLRRQNVSGRVYTAGDARSVFALILDGEGQPEDKTAHSPHGFDVLAQDLAASAKPKREAAIRALSALDEKEALELVLPALEGDRDPELRALAAAELAAHGRRGARRALRARLDDDHASVRRAAFDALNTLESDEPVAALRGALAARNADVRQLALRGLTAHFARSPLVLGLFAVHVADADSHVRRTALAELSKLFPAGSAEPLQLAFERGAADVRAEVLLRGAAHGRLSSPELVPLVGRALDDEDARVRRLAFVASALARPRLVSWLEARDEGFTRALNEFSTGVAELGVTDRAPTAEEVAAARRAFGLGPAGSAPPTLDEGDREPLLAALPCRSPDTSLAGARGLALLGDMRALGALLTISREAEPVLRRESASALVFLRDGRGRKRLIWMLNDGAAEVRAEALRCLAELEPEPLEVARAALGSAEEDVRVRGLDLLVKQKHSTASEDLLGVALEDESPKVRTEAFRTLFAWEQKRPFVPLDRALRARFPDLRARAVSELAALTKTDDDRTSSTQRLEQAIGDRDESVARAAYDAMIERLGHGRAEIYLLATRSAHAALRAKAAEDARRAPAAEMRSDLLRLLEDKDQRVRTLALESLNQLFPSDAGPLHIGLQSSFLDLRVRAAELSAVRRDERCIDPMRALLADTELIPRLGAAIAVPLRQRAATALASVGSSRLLSYFATELVKDDDPMVREQAARGLSNASRRGEEGHLLDLLGHADLAVRSWAAEGLSRLGDARALPVLTGTLKHDHPPLRIGAILSFAALGPEGYSGLLQGLEDASRPVQRVVLCVILARDLAALRAEEKPDLLANALSSARPEVRFAAARALELRGDPESYVAHLVEVLLPDRPEKASDMEKWPSEQQRAQLVVGLAEALAGDRPEQRYAAAQALRLRERPLEYFREIGRAVQPRATSAPWIPETTPQAPPSPGDEPAPAGKLLGRVRRLFAKPATGERPSRLRETTGSPEDTDPHQLRRLAFGAYVGLLRNATVDDEGHRVRRDSIERIVELTLQGHVSRASSAPALARALDDPHHLVRKAGFSALKRVYAEDAETPLALALGAAADDVVRAALDELASRGDSARPRIVQALNSKVAEARKYAFALLEKYSPKGDLEPLLAALGSEHADIRIGVIERLSTSRDARVAAALAKALSSAHQDLRVRAAELLAARHDDGALDVLSPLLRSDEPKLANRARGALAELGTVGALRALVTRFEEGVEEDERLTLVQMMGRARGAAAVEALVRCFGDESSKVRAAAFDACLSVIGSRSDAPRAPFTPERPPRNAELGLRCLSAAAESRFADLRERAARELDDLSSPATDGLLVRLLGDRELPVRVAAASAYAERVTKHGAATAPLEELLRQGARETMLAAATGLASRQNPLAFRPLLLFVRAGEPGERERALRALGTLRDVRATSDLETIARGGEDDAPVDESMQAAAIEALGRLFPALTDAEARDRVLDRIDASIGHAQFGRAALEALCAMGGERARARIESALGHETSSEAERVTAARCLGELGDTAAELALGRALRDDARLVRWTARLALERLFPDQPTRIELAAVESEHSDVSEPAARFLAKEGDAGLLLEKLSKIHDDGLRERLRYGLSRRERVEAAELARLLGHAEASARADAAWVAALRSERLDSSDRTELGRAAAAAVERAFTGVSSAVHVGDDAAQERETRALTLALWAARRLAPDAARERARAVLENHEAPRPARLEAARFAPASDRAHRDALVRALTDPELELRLEAASTLARTPEKLALEPFDAALLARARGEAPADSKALSDAQARLVEVPRLVRAGAPDLLIAQAKNKKDPARLDAIQELSLFMNDAALSALRELSRVNGGEPEDVRRAAYRSLRRIQRRIDRLEREVHS